MQYCQPHLCLRHIVTACSQCIGRRSSTTFSCQRLCSRHSLRTSGIADAAPNTLNLQTSGTSLSSSA